MRIRVERVGAWLSAALTVVALMLAPAPAGAQIAVGAAEKAPSIDWTTPPAVSFPVGQNYTLTGHSSITTASIQVYSYVGTQTPIAVGGPISCNSAGNFRIAVSPLGHTAYYAVIEGCEARSASVEAAPRIGIGKPKIPKTVKRKPHVLSCYIGQTYYANTGEYVLTLTYERYVKHRWVRQSKWAVLSGTGIVVPVQQPSADPYKVYSVSYWEVKTFTKKGKWRLHITTSATDHYAANSVYVPFKVK